MASYVAEYKKNHPDKVQADYAMKIAMNDESRQKASSHNETWAKDEDALLRDCWDNESVTDMAETLGRTIRAVCARASRIGLRRPNRKNVPYMASQIK